MLTKKQLNFIEYSIQHPMMLDAHIAQELHIAKKTVSVGRKDAEFNAEIKKQLDEQGKSYRKEAAETMITLCRNGDRQAAQFILQTTGVNPEQNVNVNAEINTVHITVDES